MGHKRLQSSGRDVWALARRQHGVVARRQLIAIGMTGRAIQHRIERGRLHRLAWGVYAVGRPEVELRGRWMAAVLSCGPEALLGYGSAAMLWGLAEVGPASIEVVVPAHVARRRPGVRVHRRSHLGARERSTHRLIPVTSPTTTLIDFASLVAEKDLEAAVNAADRLNLIDPEALRREVASTPPRPGLPALRKLLDRHTYSRTDSVLERRFLRLVRSARLPAPRTQAWVNGFRVDFFWPELGLVVETDGLRYHRTPAQQAHDLRREQAHAAAGLTALRFSAAQVREEPTRVLATMREVVARLERSTA
jgi:very-short-patch-repair endonuclease